MKDQRPKFRHGNPKKCSYKLKSRRKQLRKARLSLESQRTSANLDQRASPTRIAVPSFKGKKFQGIYLNQLHFYQKTGRSRHLRRISDVLPSSVSSEPSQSVLGFMAFSFLVSADYVQRLSFQPSRKVFVVDAMNEQTEHALEKPDESTMVVHLPKNTGQNIATSFHPKFLLMKLPDAIQIVIETGNFLACDWEEFGNAFFNRIFPACSTDDRPPNQTRTPIQIFVDLCLGPFASESLSFASIDLREYIWNAPEVCPLVSFPGKALSTSEYVGSFFQLRQILATRPPLIPFTANNQT